MLNTHQTGKDALFVYGGVDLAKEGGKIGKAISMGGKAIGLWGAGVGTIGGYLNFQNGNKIRGAFDIGISVLPYATMLVETGLITLGIISNPVGWIVVGATVISTAYTIGTTIYDLSK